MTLPTPEQTPSRQVRVPQRPPARDASELVTDLINTVTSATKEGKLHWRATENSANAEHPRYEVDLDSGNLEVGSMDDDGITPFDLRIFSPGPDYKLLDVI